jgi:hypothetical protein
LIFEKLVGEKSYPDTFQFEVFPPVCIIIITGTLKDVGKSPASKVQSLIPQVTKAP